MGVFSRINQSIQSSTCGLFHTVHLPQSVNHELNLIEHGPNHKEILVLTEVMIPYVFHLNMVGSPAPSDIPRAAVPRVAALRRWLWPWPPLLQSARSGSGRATNTWPPLGQGYYLRWRPELSLAKLVNIISLSLWFLAYPYLIWFLNQPMTFGEPPCRYIYIYIYNDSHQSWGHEA